MNIINKKDIKSFKILDLLELDDNQEYTAGVFHNVEKIRNNNDFLDVYRHIKFFGFPLSNEMLEYASIPNYAPKSLLENIKLSGEDNEYYPKLKELIENKENKYKTRSIIEPKIETFQHLVEINRADLTDKFLDDGVKIEDLYSNVSTGNSCLEICKKFTEFGHYPVDEIIFYYMTFGLGGVAEVCLSHLTDMDFITDCEPLDLDSLLIICKHKYCNEENYNNEDPIASLPSSIANKMIDVCFEFKNKTDIAMFMKLYSIVSDEMLISEKFYFLNRILDKKESFFISIFLRQLVNEGVSISALESQIYYKSKSFLGYQIFKLEIECETNYDFIYNLCSDLEENFETKYYEEEYESDSCSCSSYSSSYCSSESNSTEQDYEYRENYFDYDSD